MKTRKMFGRLACWLVLALLTPGARAQNGFFTIHSFGASSGTTSEAPFAGVVMSGNMLYGTTESSAGRVFECSTDGTYFTNLYTFGGEANPVAGLVLGGSILYGATENPGIVFAIGTNVGSSLNILWNFGNGGGQNPRSTMVLSGGTLYGTTLDGDNLFKVNIDSTGFSNLYTFSSETENPVTRVYTNSDGNELSYGSLVMSGTVLYGVAEGGGTNGNGTVFKFDTFDSTFTTLHCFGAFLTAYNTNSDGASPIGGMALSGSTLYGTTSAGGSSGNGTVFGINTDGTGFTNLHNFTGLTSSNNTNTDGAVPYGGLIVSGTTLYGTTPYGGTGGSGTVFQLKTDGTGFRTLYSFSPTIGEAGVNKDGASPNGTLSLSGNALYGTAYGGGVYGGGTIFALSIFAPPVPLNIQVAGNSFVLTWSNPGLPLQSSTNLSAGFTDVAGATSPYTNTFAGAQTFFRLGSN